MPYVPDAPYVSPYPFSLREGTEVDIAAYQQKLTLWHVGESIVLDGGVVIGGITIQDEFAELLNNLHDEYAQVSIPGSSSAFGLPERRFQYLKPKAKAVVYGVHAAFREIVRLDAERSGLMAPNATVGGTNIGMFSGEDDWHCDGWLVPAVEEERYDQLFGNGIIRYGLSLGAPGTVMLAGQLRRAHIVDGFLLGGMTDSETTSLTHIPHASGDVVRFVSDYDVHRAPRLKRAVGRYFTTASVLLPLTETCRAI